MSDVVMFSYRFAVHHQRDVQFQSKLQLEAGEEFDPIHGGNFSRSCGKNRADDVSVLLEKRVLFIVNIDLKNRRMDANDQ